MKIILTGSAGLIGSRFKDLLGKKHEIVPFSTDITIIDAVDHFFSDKNADVVVHLAAKTEVDECELDKEKDEELIKKNIGEQFEVENMRRNINDFIATKTAFAVNFYGTKLLYNVAQEKGIKFVYISTDFVFEGKDKYDEESKPNPLNWYGETKYYGERLIDISKDLIVRLSFPYGYKTSVKKDFVWRLIDLLKERKEVSLIEDETITPTFIDDIVFGLEFLVLKNATGIYHLTGSSFEDPYQIGKKIADKFDLKTKLNATTRNKIYAGKANRPFQSIMKNDKIRNLGFTPKTFDEGFDLISNI